MWCCVLGVVKRADSICCITIGLVAMCRFTFNSIIVVYIKLLMLVVTEKLCH